MGKGDGTVGNVLGGKEVHPALEAGAICVTRREPQAYRITIPTTEPEAKIAARMTSVSTLALARLGCRVARVGEVKRGQHDGKCALYWLEWLCC